MVWCEQKKTVHELVGRCISGAGTDLRTSCLRQARHMGYQGSYDDATDLKIC